MKLEKRFMTVLKSPCTVSSWIDGKELLFVAECGSQTAVKYIDFTTFPEYEIMMQMVLEELGDRIKRI